MKITANSVLDARASQINYVVLLHWEPELVECLKDGSLWRPVPNQGFGNTILGLVTFCESFPWLASCESLSPQ